MGGRLAVGPGLTGGQFIEPTIFANLTNDMRTLKRKYLARCFRL
jgi:acyl-CoA reductase-like NAD-dependent aldehyde dehydrogenase